MKERFNNELLTRPNHVKNCIFLTNKSKTKNKYPVITAYKINMAILAVNNNDKLIYPPY